MTTTPPETDTDETEGETAFDLLQDRHTVHYLRAEYRKIPLRPNPDGKGVSQGRDQFVETHPDNSPEPTCSCGREFDNKDEARTHLRRVSAVLSGEVDPRKFPLKFTGEAETLSFEVANADAVEARIRHPAAFMADREIYRGSPLSLIEDGDVQTVAAAFPYSVGLPRMFDDIQRGDSGFYDLSTAFPCSLREDLLAKAVRWFIQTENLALDELSLWYSGANSYLLAPSDSCPSQSVPGIVIGGAHNVPEDK